MKRDYHSTLARATGALDPNTPEARRAIYARARSAILNADLATSDVQDELSALERAIDRIESEAAQPRARKVTLGRSRESHDLPSEHSKMQRKTWSSAAVFRAASFLFLGVLVFLAAVFGYSYWPRTGKSDRDSTAEPRVTTAVIAEPGRTSKEVAPHIFNRQLVYYRSTHPAGTIVIAKSQRFLYLVRPDVVALRYTIGVGGECSKAVGLLLVSGKEDWGHGQQQSVTNDVGARVHGVGARPSEGVFGARSLSLGDTGLRIHGTNATANVAETACFRLVNEDMIDLYDRVIVGTRVIVN